jgi:hypothetical protein
MADSIFSLGRIGISNRLRLLFSQATGFLGATDQSLARGSRFCLTRNSWQIIWLRKHGYSSLSTSLLVLVKANAPPN